MNHTLVEDDKEKGGKRDPGKHRECQRVVEQRGNNHLLVGVFSPSPKTGQDETAEATLPNRQQGAGMVTLLSPPEDTPASFVEVQSLY